MHGTNPIRPPDKGCGSALDIQSMFLTLQGEGPHAGRPALFIRLGGCNLACVFCDTEFESFRRMTLDEVMREAARLRGSATLVVITGGEPLRQPIAPLCEELLAAGLLVQIETNGTLWRPLPDQVEVVCSPKNTGQGYVPIRPDVAARAVAFKFLVSAHVAGYGDIAAVGQGDVPVYIQPIDEHDGAKNAENLALAMRLSYRHNARLSIQLHKILGIE